MAPASESPLKRYESIVDRAVQLAARAGRLGKDEVDVSYTSLLIALLALEDETANWLNRSASVLEADLAAVLQTRKIKRTDLPQLREQTFSGERLESVSFSPSARRVLAAAQDIADETSGDGEGVVATRHIASVYFFRNPPDHQQQLEKLWRFDPEKWRAAFLDFITRAFTSESAFWEPVFAPYFEPASLERLPFTLASRYRISEESKQVFTRWWGGSEGNGPYRVLRLVDLVKAGAVEGLFDRGGAPAKEAATLAGFDVTVAVEAPARLALEAAQSLAFTTTEHGEICPRHLAASILLNQYAARLAAEEVGRPPAVLRRELLQRIHRDFLADDPVQWRKALITDRQPELAAYQPDNPDTGEDQLDVRRFAAAFALLISSTEVKPPLAIGISGNWGSGKSFFMRLMREETRRITALAQSDPRFHSNVVPIEFNAWHYAEKDLLASLVQEIFKTLQQALIVPPAAPSEAEAVLSQLEGAKTEREKAAQEAERARAAVDASRRQLDETRRQAALRAGEAKLSAAEVAEANAPLLKEALAPLGLERLAQAIDQGADRAAQVRAAIERVEQTGLRARSALDWLLRAPIKWSSIALAVGVIAVIGAIAYGLREEINHAWLAAGTFLTQFSALAALCWRWASRYLATVDQGLAKFDEVRQAIDAKAEEKRAELNLEVANAQAALEEEYSRLKKAQEALEKANERVASAELALEQTRSLNRLAGLVNDRLASRDYEKYLGVVAAVRKDFKELSDLIRKAAEEAATSNLSFRRIDRIVLYIDDLDRCPTDKVILVLEAIHLLLAFDLFVVVVGLDIRWASHSLEERFARQLRADGGATALDYLEKIFQIAFWLPPMEPDASRQLLAANLPGKGAAATQKKEGASGGTSGSRQGAQRQQGGGRQVAAPAPVQAETELLTIQPQEREFMYQLAPALSRSPRRLKRFVNTYLLLRASLNDAQRETFIKAGGGDYREAMTLLALINMAPQAWIRIQRELESSAPPETLAALRSFALEAAPPGEAPYVIEALDLYGKFELSTANLAAMIPQATRFSFHYSLS